MARRHLLLLTLLSGTALCQSALADPAIDDERLRAGVYPAAPAPERFVPAETAHPPFDLQWSIGLKGTYTNATTGNSFSGVLEPSFTATHEGVRTDIVVDGKAQIARDWQNGENIEMPSLRLGVSATTMLDSQTTASGDAVLTLDQELRSDPGLDPLIIEPPQVLAGSVGAGIDRSFGRFNLALRGDLERTLYGPTTRSDTGRTDNSGQDLWELDSTLRLGFEATPIIEVFTEASLGRDLFDREPAQGPKRDATAMALRGGIAGSWNGVLAASASAGYGYHDFDAEQFGDVGTQLYDASVTFTPDETISLAAGLRTSIDPAGADSDGTARISTVATADLSYVVNSRLRLRASADWGHWRLTGSSETEEWRGAGVGADYKFNSRTALSADYGYEQRENSDSGAQDSHTVSLGVTLQR